MVVKRASVGYQQKYSLNSVLQVFSMATPFKVVLWHQSSPSVVDIRVYRYDMSCVTRKCALRSLSLSYRLQNTICEGSRVQFYSRCHTKRRIGGAPARQSFFVYDNDKDFKVCFLVTRLVCFNVFDPTSDPGVLDLRLSLLEINDSV